ncbi:MAG: hypothetical protein ACHQHN_11815 [Sphingobacteriales bacterium]
MKKFYLFLIVIVFAVNFSHAQWTTSGSNTTTTNNIGIGTATPSTALQIGDFSTGGSNNQLLIPGVYNFEHARFGQTGNGNLALEFVNHTSISESYGIKFLVNVDGGAPGLQLQYAPPASAYSSLSYTTGLYMALSGKIGIGTTSPGGVLQITNNVPYADNSANQLVLTNGGYRNSESGALPVDNAGLAYYFTNYNAGGKVYDRSLDIKVRGAADGTFGAGMIRFFANNYTAGSVEREIMRIHGNGNVLIGKTSQINTSYMLDVAGAIRSSQVVVNTTGADFVFTPAYRLNSLAALKRYIDQNHHLPECLLLEK